MEDDVIKFIWYVNIQCNNVKEARRSDLIFMDKKWTSCILIDIAVPGACRIHEKEIEKIDKYQNLKRELKRLKSMNVQSCFVAVYPPHYNHFFLCFASFNTILSLYSKSYLPLVFLLHPFSSSGKIGFNSSIRTRPQALDLFDVSINAFAFENRLVFYIAIEA